MAKKLKVQIIPRKKLCHTLGKVMAKWQKRFFSYTLIGFLGEGEKANFAMLPKLCHIDGKEKTLKFWEVMANFAILP